MNKPAFERLCAFRQAIYTTLGCRRDALAEILDALLTSPVIEHPVHLSLAPGFQRAWSSIYDALNAGTMSLPRLEQLVAAQPLETSTAWYAVDASVWPRCDAETSPQRGYYHHHSRHSHGQPIVAGWNYSWLVQVPERCSSWTAPLRVCRVQPGDNVNRVAAEQIRSFLCQRGGEGPHPIFTFDAGYDPVQLGIALAGLDVSALVRLRAGRCFYADPPQGPTGGRPRRHGAKLVCDDPTTWPAPTAEWSTTDVGYGQVRIQCWSRLHAIPHNHEKRGTRQARPMVRGTLIRLEVERLPTSTKAPVPLWLWWYGPERPDLATIWRIYVARFSIEHTLRFCKQVLKWTTPKLRSPEAADRWTWLVILAYVHLRLARPLVVDHRLRGPAPLPTEKLTPARIRRAFSQLPRFVTKTPGFDLRPGGDESRN
jgi:hypothetical protein